MLTISVLPEQLARERGVVTESAPHISVVVPTYRRPELLKRCLTALAAQSLPPSAFEVVIADDEPSEETRKLVERWSESSDCIIRYVPVRGPHGPAAARNVGWHAARGEIIAFTDDDCIPQSQWLQNGL